MTDTMQGADMTGNEFLRKLKKLGKDQGQSVEYIVHRGKGSHGTVYYGNRFCIIKDLKKEIGPGLLLAMCKQLNIEVRNLDT
jgi:predicted RNA binding protein YcfA (HicA-like mRNA interferase family)